MTKVSVNGYRNLSIVLHRYAIGDRLAVSLERGGELYYFVSHNLPDEPLADGEFAVKTYRDNEGVYEALIDCGAIEFTGRYANEMRLPICTIGLGVSGAATF